MLYCDICYRHRRKKSTLSCGHVLCTECWNKWQHTELHKFNKKFPTCPTCRKPQEQHKPYQSIQLLIFIFLVFWCLSAQENSKHS